MDLDSKADELIRQLAELEGVSPDQALVIAMEEALERRRPRETPIEGVRRLLAENGITLSEQARQPLPKKVFDEMWGDHFQGED